RLRHASHVPAALGRGRGSLRRCLPERDRRPDRATQLHRVGPGADRRGRGARRDEPLQHAGEPGVPSHVFEGQVPALARHPEPHGHGADASLAHRTGDRRHHPQHRGRGARGARRHGARRRRSQKRAAGRCPEVRHESGSGRARVSDRERSQEITHWQTREAELDRLSKALAGSVVALALVAASTPAEATRIVFITHAQAVDAFWSVVKNGVDDAAELMGVEVQYQAPQTFDMVQMAQLIDAAVATRPDGLVVSIPDAEALGDSIRAAVAAGIPVISMDAGLDVSKELGALLHMGIDEYPSGFAAGEKMKELGKTSGACVNMEVGNVALDQRCQGFADALGGNSQVIATSIDPIEIKNGVAGYLMQHPEIDAVLTAGATAFDPT